MDKLFKSIIFLLIIVFFSIGIITSFFLNNNGIKILIWSVKSPVKDYFFEIVKTYNPSAATAILYKDGTLKRVSNNEIVVISNKGGDLSIPINNEMRKIISYEYNTSHRPAKKSDFTVGSKVVVKISVDWISDKITDFSLGLKTEK